MTTASRTMVDEVLRRLWSAFEKLYSHTGRPSIPPELSQRLRKRVEEIFGWLKTVGMTRKVRHRGLPRVDWNVTFALAAYNLVRIRNLTASRV